MVILDQIRNDRGEVIGTRERVEDGGECDRIPGLDAATFHARRAEAEAERFRAAVAVWVGTARQPKNGGGVKQGQEPTPRKPVVVGGAPYPSVYAAAKALGVYASTIHKAMRYGRRVLGMEVAYANTNKEGAAA